MNSSTLTEELDTLFDLSRLFAEEGPSLNNMAEEKTLKELDAPLVQQAPLCITTATVQAALEMKSGLIHLLPKFRGLANEDPSDHLKEFHVVCSSMKLERIIEEHIKLRAFPFSLEDATKKWVNNVRRELCGIKQHIHGTLFDYWERFKEFCASFPQHRIPEQALINFFYEGLFLIARSSVEGASGGLIVEKTPIEARQLIEIVTSTSRQFRVTSNVFNAMKHPDDIEECSRISVIDTLSSSEFMKHNLNPLETTMVLNSCYLDQKTLEQIRWIDDNQNKPIHSRKFESLELGSYDFHPPKSSLD
ncbi:uncharacterized protein G2W53_004274 [Senna tora]|uniref:Retrotransposon gag domain-containing protein n=1 Tax=Senna tora TaxID=362788 RepID=A0A835CGD8_9FABA|nr:uncharacterized protein G2W53_004274 [Senna tora]